MGRPAEAIRLDEVWAVVGGADTVIGVHGPNPSCPVGFGIRSAMAEIECELVAVVRADLARRTVRDLLDHVPRHADLLNTRLLSPGRVV